MRHENIGGEPLAPCGRHRAHVHVDGRPVHSYRRERLKRRNNHRKFAPISVGPGPVRPAVRPTPEKSAQSPSRPKSADSRLVWRCQRGSVPLILRYPLELLFHHLP